MSNRVSLNDLIESMANAVIEAQDQIEQHQIANIRRYFDSDNRPVSVHLRVPSIHPEAEEGAEDHLRIPLLALVSNNPLKIKEVEISFDADITEFEGPADDSNDQKSQDKEWRGKSAAKAIKVDMRSGLLKKDKKTAHVVLKVEGGEPTEGMARLIHELNKFI